MDNTTNNQNNRQSRILPAMRVPDPYTRAMLGGQTVEENHKLPFFDFLWENKVKLACGIFFLFFVIYALLTYFRLLPQSLLPAPDQTASASPVQAAIVNDTINQSPVRIIISSIGVDAPVSNPKSDSVDVLDEYLQEGAVRYPGSADLGRGNTYIFGHSTNHAVVINQAYKTFDNFDKLSPGDMITVDSIDRAYLYKVESVRLTSAGEAFVSFTTKENMLTLSTCDTFAATSARWVVEASFVSSAPINNQTI